MRLILNLSTQVISREEAKRLNAVEFDFKNVDSVAKAIGNASKVVVTVGPVEDGPRGQVSVNDALRVIEAAQLANVNHFVAVYEPGTGSVADGPLAGISSFFSNLFNRGTGGAKDDMDLLYSLVETDLKYTFIRTPSTEGVDDYSPSTSNLVVAAEGVSDSSGKVNDLVFIKGSHHYTNYDFSSVPMSEISQVAQMPWQLISDLAFLVFLT